MNSSKLLELSHDNFFDMIMWIQLQMHSEDLILFKLSTSGNFVLKNMWNIVSPNSMIFNDIGNKNICISYSILVW